MNGYLSEFSLAELFRLIEEGNKTGLLTIQSLEKSDSDQEISYHIWFRQGAIVAFANCLDSQCLLSLIEKRGWLSDGSLQEVLQVCSLEKPLGLLLKNNQLVDAEQLKLLYSSQVMHPIAHLFSLKDGLFNFDSEASLPMMEMTGISSLASSVTLEGLRILEDWSALAEKIPQPTSGLINIGREPKVNLDKTEWQVWECTNGQMSLSEIANQLKLPINKVQEIAFRLIVVGLTEEIPMITEQKNIVGPNENNFSKSSSPKTNNISQSFLENLLGFCETKFK